MTDIRTEQIKLRAAYYNGVAVSVVAVGGLGVALSFIRENHSWRAFLSAVALFMACSVISIIMRELAVSYLKDIDKAP